MKNSLFGIVLLTLLFAGTSFADSKLASKEEAHEQEAAAVSRDKPLLAGEKAPDFTLATSLGQNITLSQFRGNKNVVLYFYPKDNTPGCTTEAKNFNTDYASFEKAGAAVLGVSIDDERSHKFFSEKLGGLKFPLLADHGGKIARQYGVMGWIMAKRVTYIIDKQGKIAQVYPEVSVGEHSKEVLKFVQAMK